MDQLSVCLIVVDFALLAAPLFWDVSTGARADGMQGHEPAIFAVSALLLYRQRHAIAALPSSAPWIGITVVTVALLPYLFGRAYDLRIALISLNVLLAGVLLRYRGGKGLRLGWFAVAFPIFALPLPFEFVLAVTGPMKIAVSAVATELLSWLGYPTGRSGIVMTIGQYQLLMTEACAGLQTMFTLEAMGLLYATLMNHGSARRKLALAVLIVPIAFLANVIRVVVLALVTYYWGDAAGQAFLHGISGIVLFLVALVLVILTDALLGRLNPVDQRA